MSWLRVDDGFTSNSKIVQLSDSQFRVWVRVLCHCARSLDPTVDTAAIREISGLDRRVVKHLAQVGLLDQVGESWEVHDWVKYLPKDAQNAARQAKWRARERNARRNANVDAESNAEVTPSRAGTRGSRPVPDPCSTDVLSDSTKAVDKTRNGGATWDDGAPIPDAIPELPEEADVA